MGNSSAAIRLVEEEQRALRRQTGVTTHVPVSCKLNVHGETLNASVINFHFNGACLQVAPGDVRAIQSGVTLDFILGNKNIRTRVAFRICWEDIAKTGQFGIQFKESLEKYFRSFERVQSNQLYPPTLVAKDPTNPTRKIYFQVIDFSQTGMGLMTSATNNGIFPGMSLEKSILTVPGNDPVIMDLYIESIRPGKIENTFFVGTTIRTRSKDYQNIVSEYALSVSPTPVAAESRLEHLLDTIKLSAKALKAGLTYRVITNQFEYDKVLKLRHLGYSKAGKVKEGKTWQEMGEGLADEGTILGAFLGSELVGSVEVRLGSKMFLRTVKSVPKGNLAAMDLSRLMEPNRLVVHPRAQGTDIVIGIIQKLHAMAVLEGNVDVILLATDKLAPFYALMGAKPTGDKVPHALLAGQNLNVMIAYYSTYAKGEGLNPYFWSQIWQATHDYLKEMGLTEDIKETPLRIIRRSFGKALWNISLLKKKKKSSKNAAKKTNSSGGQRFIDPKWTEQHLCAPVLLPYLLKAEALIGKMKVNSILETLGMPREYFLHQSNWFSIHFYDRFIEEYRKFSDVEQLQSESGRMSMQKEILGFTYYFLKYFGSFELLAKEIKKVANRFNKTRTYEVIHLQKGKCTVEIGYTDANLLPKDPSACLNWIGCFKSAVELVNGKAPKVQKTACCLKGDPACVYKLEWEDHRKVVPKIVIVLFPALLTLGCFLVLFYQRENLPKSGLISSIFLSLSLITVFYYRTRAKYDQLTKEFEKYHQESDDRYGDLQKSKAVLDQNYQESTLLAELSREIQKSDSLTHILNMTVSMICKNFDLSRSFIMLLDREKNFLKTAAVGGVQGSADLIWKYAVDVSSVREDPMVLSSAFFTSQPILIADVEKQKFQFNSNSLALLDQMKSDGFIIVAIPALDRNWGVIVADKEKGATKLDRRHVVILQRVAQILGLALDKKSRLEQEEQMRRMFQKYVPSRVINGMPDAEEQKLGGKAKDISCMFIDIRGFTKMSQTYPSEIVLDILNRFFTAVQKVISKHHGIIDKFLGDGVLVTWGTTEELEKHAELAVAAALEVLSESEILSKQFTENSLPKLDIGIGINTGSALVGNVGSEERMEFTAIGPTVNVASRLEGLCKTYESRIVISDSVLSKIENQDTSKWKKIENVEIRGIDRPVRIGILNEIYKLEKK